MNKIFKPRHYLPLVFLFVLVTLILPRSPEWKYNYSKGAQWPYNDLVAEFDFPILKSDEQVLDEIQRLGIQARPCFRYSEELVYRMLAKASKVEVPSYPDFGGDLSSALFKILEKGIIADDGIPGAADMIYIQKNKKIVGTPSGEVYSLSAACDVLRDEMIKIIPATMADSLLFSGGVRDIVVPNLIYDQQLSDFLREEIRNSVSTTSGYVRAGSTIISKGEIVTADQVKVLDSYKKEYRKIYDSVGIKVWLGNAMLAMILVLIFAMLLSTTSSNVFGSYGKYLYLVTVFTISVVIFMTYVRNGNMMLILPVTMAAWLLEIFFGRRLSASIYALSLTPLLLLSAEGSAYLIIFLSAGIAHAASFKHFGRKWKLFISALIAYAAGAFSLSTMVLMGFLDGNIGVKYLSLALCIALSLACYPLEYLFEKLFNLTSGSRLRELAETNSSVLREMEQTAPGTFQHSLQVMNMSDVAARAIGADRDLVRAGAMYHDIGKMNNPMCFVENETILNKEDTPKYHDSLSPLQSAQNIIKHVSDGMVTAQKHHLPQVVSDFILTHHGTSCVSFFYDKHIKHGGSEEDRKLFCYDGHRPWTREQAIVMICDALEASSRSLKNFSEQSVSELVDYIFSSKFNEGQFAECEISIKEVEIMKQTLKTYIVQLHHERIAYPKNRNK